MALVKSPHYTGKTLDENTAQFEQKVPLEQAADCEANSHEFNFPFPPYNIQVELMKVAYETFEHSKFALLESPTGTGKTLSLISSSLTWLRDYQKKERQTLERRRDELGVKIEELVKNEDEAGDWLSVQTKRQTLTRELNELDKQLERLNKFDQRNHDRNHAKLHGIPLENYASFSTSATKTPPNKTSTVFDPLNESTKETNVVKGLVSEISTGVKLEQSQEKAQSFDDDDDVDEADMDQKVAQQDEDHIKPKIYYASRTHSQLSQFINEVKRTKFAKINLCDALQPAIKLAALASRANLCINPDVLKLKDSSAINERCMEMQKENKPENRCPFIKAKDVNRLKNDILSSVYDIEDLVSRGKFKGACPYYASRMAIPEAELVALPYNNLLHRETRQASSLDLKDNIIIIDEAHNILETICSIHSAPITGVQLIGCHTIFSRYYKKYNSRMSSRNASMVKTIVLCLTAIIRYLQNPRKHLKDYECPKSIDLDDNLESQASKIEMNRKANQQGRICKPVTKHEEIMLGISKFIGASNVERFNVYKILDYLNRSQLARKLLGLFRQDNSLDLEVELHEETKLDSDCSPKSKTNQDEDLQSPKRKKKKTLKLPPPLSSSKVPISRRWEYSSLRFLVKSPPSPCIRGTDENQQLNTYPVYNFIEFLRSLTNLSDDGKILTEFYENDVYKSFLKYILLNPSSQFKQMVEEARSIVLAGGTMQPFEEFLQLLFFPLGISDKRITLFSCGHVISPDNLFMASLCSGPSNKILELSYKVRHSFETIDEIGRTIMNFSFIVPGGMVCFFPSYDYEQICFKRWTQIGVISKIETRSKQVFREPRQATHLKPIFDEYSKVIENGKANGRGSLLLCVVGGKMSEGINFNDDLGRCVIVVGLPYANIKSGELQEKMAYYDKNCKRANGSSPGNEYYENLCLKGINQSIGRAIRHKNDYAAVILLDHRYQSKSSIKNGLPKWMCKSLNEYQRFGSSFSQLKVFYNNRS